MFRFGMSLWDNLAAQSAAPEWDAVSLGGSFYTLSGTGNLTATRTSGTGFHTIRSTAAKASGNALFTWVAYGTGNFVIGLISTSQADGSFPGADNTSIGVFPTTGAVYRNNVSVATISSPGVGATFEWDYTGSTAVLKVNGTTAYTDSSFSIGNAYAAFMGEGVNSAASLSGW